MTPRKDNFPHPDPPARSPSLQVVNPHAAAVDIGAAEHWVAVPPDRDAQPVRRFGTCTLDLEALADWLLACDIMTVAMASTGVYWIPLFAVLETRGFQALLIDPRQAQRAPGRPTSDPRDCQWLQRLHAYGLLAGAFRPDDQVCVLRAYLRQRQRLITHASQHMQHMQKALEQMHVKLPEVVSDVTGVTGMAIIKVILAGERDPVTLAKLRDRRCKHGEEQIAKALQGTWRAEHLFALRQAVELYEFSHRQLATCDAQIAAQLATFPDPSGGQPLPPKPRKSKRKAHAPRFDVRTPLYRMAGVDLTALAGIMEEYEAQYRDRKVKGMARQAKALGSTLVPLAAPDGQAMPAVAGSPSSKQTTSHRRSDSRMGERGLSTR